MNDNFSFRLQRVLDYREYVKNQKAEELARYRALLDRERDTLNGLQVKKNTVAHAMDEMQQGCQRGVPGAAAGTWTAEEFHRQAERKCVGDGKEGGRMP